MEVTIEPKLYERLSISLIDLGFASDFAKRLLKKGLHHGPWDRRETVYNEQVAFTSALVMFYTRPFTHSDGWPDFPKRLLQYDSAEIQLHDQLLTLRNRILMLTLTASTMN